MLEEYKKKRDFGKTPEPEAKTDGKTGNRFVIQEHHASQLHYDFRLEMDGVLKSWAVPKGVPESSGTKHLAVETEDHPTSYIDFAGTIPEGQYGAGTVKIWDKGEYEMIRQTANSLEFSLSGKKLSGIYVMIKAKFKGEKNTWLIWKKAFKK